jgi:ABC-type Zn uptake system ZnuABC Zn-binding protein ZnuA
MFLRVVVLAATAALPACGGGAATSGGPLHVLATTTLLASLASDVGRGRADVTSLMPVGASPETYQPAPADMVRVQQAGLIVENGAGLEAWLAPMLRSGAKQTPIVNCSDGLTIVAANPHLWLDPVYARHYVGAMRDGMVAADPAGAATYRANAAALDARLAALTVRIRRQLATIAPALRLEYARRDRRSSGQRAERRAPRATDRPRARRTRARNFCRARVQREPGQRGRAQRGHSARRDALR